MFHENGQESRIYHETSSESALWLQTVPGGAGRMHSPVCGQHSIRRREMNLTSEVTLARILFAAHYLPSLTVMEL